MTATAFQPIPHVWGEVMSKAEIAGLFGEAIVTVDGWVRAGCPCRRTGAMRSPLEFDTAQVHAWLCIREAEKRGEHAAEMMRVILERDALEAELARRL